MEGLRVLRSFVFLSRGLGACNMVCTTGMNDSVNKLSGSVGVIPHGGGHSVSAINARFARWHALFVPFDCSQRAGKGM